MEQKILGVIGGMGPKATAVFFDTIIERTAASRDQDHINMVILNHATIPDRTQVIAQGQADQFLTTIARDFALLEQAGAANIAIPCNTSHYFYEHMQAMTSVPIINMIDETWKVVFERFGAGCRAAVLATTGTISTKVYAKGIAQYPMQLVEPPANLQQEVMDIIYTDVKANNNCDPERLQRLIDQMIEQYECDCVILACTELSCIALDSVYKNCTVDAMQTLVDRAIILSGKQVNQQL
ncbi:aspartate/glutamate racemase family protein [Paenibacillus yanchengensis]|uniref:Aspartate/glutamate racemase family protein n=1 Tax=Paenibacillus yanchengensis TaxID=2035833 RepID=A0ABW4YN74_9BACL